MFFHINPCHPQVINPLRNNPDTVFQDIFDLCSTCFAEPTEAMIVFYNHFWFPLEYHDKALASFPSVLQEMLSTDVGSTCMHWGRPDNQLNLLLEWNQNELDIEAEWFCISEAVPSHLVMFFNHTYSKSTLNKKTFSRLITKTEFLAQWKKPFKNLIDIFKWALKTYELEIKNLDSFKTLIEVEAMLPDGSEVI